MGAGAIQLQFRRGVNAVMKNFVGAQGEVCVDLTSMRMVVHDGTTIGGWPQERAGLTLVTDSNYTVLPTDVIVLFATLTAARTVTLPPLSNYPSGQKLTVVDGTATSSANTITLQTASTVDKLPGGSTTLALPATPSTNTSFSHVSLMAGPAVAAAGSITAVTQQWIRI